MSRAASQRRARGLLFRPQGRHLIPSTPGSARRMPSTDSKSDLGKSDSRAEHNNTSLPVFDLPSEGEIDLGALQASDDVVNLDMLPEAPSGQSLTSWTAIIRRQQEAQAAAAEGIRVDAPS